MARQIGFHLYSFKVWQKFTSSREVLSSISGRQDVLQLLKDGMDAEQNRQRNDVAAHRMYCVKRADVDGRHLTGLIEAGHYGQSANIVHNTSGRTNYRQVTAEATMLPCFFRLVIPPGEERGVLILQRDNRVPAKQSLASVFQLIIYRFDDKLTCDFTPIANKATFERLIQDGDVQEIRFIKMSIPQDFADGYDRGRDQTEGTMQVSFTARRNGTLPMKRTLSEWLRGEASVRDQYEIPGLDFDFDTVKADLRIGKKLQTVDFGRKVSQPIIDLTDQVIVDPATGHPLYDSLREATAELAEDDAFTAYSE